jgi:hypothetical protein
MTPPVEPAIASPESLRAVGSLLDQQPAHLCSLAVVPAGLVVVARRAVGTEALLLTPADLAHFRADHRAQRGQGRWTPPTDPLVPTGHEDLLRALGTLAVRYGWTWLRLVRTPTALLLHHGTHEARQSTALTAENLAQLLELSYIQRGAIHWALAQPRPEGRTHD